MVQNKATGTHPEEVAPALCKPGCFSARAQLLIHRGHVFAAWVFEAALSWHVGGAHCAGDETREVRESVAWRDGAGRDGHALLYVI